MKYRSQLLNSTVPDTTSDKNTHQNGTGTGLFTDGITDIGAISLLNTPYRHQPHETPQHYSRQI